MHDLIWTCVDRVFADEKTLLHTFAQMLLTVIKPPALANQVNDQHAAEARVYSVAYITSYREANSEICFV